MADAGQQVSQNAAEVSIALQQLTLRQAQSDADAWAAFRLSSAQGWETIRQRQAQNAVSQDNTAGTENQQTTSPIRTGAGDAVAAVPGVAAGQVAANIPAMNELVSQLAYAIASALAPVLVNASGGASTPSQTQAKPASS
jgi:hypothetical protein